MTGNLKHKDLYGQVVSSQVYDNGDDDMDREAENNSEPDTVIPDDDHEQGDNDKWIRYNKSQIILITYQKQPTLWSKTNPFI